MSVLSNFFVISGRSILHDILDINLPKAIIIDYQHCSLLRHAKTMFRTIYNQLKPADRDKLDIKMKDQLFPHFFNRHMKSLKEFSFIKAVELRNILLYGFLPLSFELVNTRELAHFALFVCSIRLYHSQPPLYGKETRKIAERLFLKYYEDHPKYYRGVQNYVLHLHQHFGEQYVNYGSLSNVGCFSQEDLIGHLSNHIHGTRYFGDLIVHYYNIDFFLHNHITHTTYELVSKPIDININFIIDDYPILLRHHDKVCTCINHRKCIFIYRRCIIRNNVFHSLLYKQRGNSNSCFISYYKLSNNTNKRFGQILFFFA